MFWLAALVALAPALGGPVGEHTDCVRTDDSSCDVADDVSLLQSTKLRIGPKCLPDGTNCDRVHRARTSKMPECQNMTKVNFAVNDFVPLGTGLPSGSVTVYGCSNAKLDAVQGKKGVVIFLHGAWGSADSYAEIFPEKVHLPDDYNIVFLSTPREDPVWMHVNHSASSLNEHWYNPQVEDATVVVSKVVDQVAALYGGHQYVWIAGYSQGAVISSTVALKGNRNLLAGAFAVAGFPPRPLHTDEHGAEAFPADWSADEIERKKQTNIYFYTGEFDTVLPLAKAFCRYQRVLDAYGLDPANYRFWQKPGWCHYTGEREECPQISPDGSEFLALWKIIGGTPDDVEHVEPVTPGTDCEA